MVRLLCQTQGESNAENTEDYKMDDMMDDMITKQQAIDALCMLLDNWFNTDWRKHINIVAAIEQIPSVQPESKRKWYMKGYRDAQQKILRWVKENEEDRRNENI